LSVRAHQSSFDLMQSLDALIVQTREKAKAAQQAEDAASIAIQKEFSEAKAKLDSVTQVLSNLAGKQSSLISRCTTHSQEHSSLLTTLSQKTDEIQTLEYLHAYLSLLLRTQAISRNLSNPIPGFLELHNLLKRPDESILNSNSHSALVIGNLSRTIRHAYTASFSASRAQLANDWINSLKLAGWPSPVDPSDWQLPSTTMLSLAEQRVFLLVTPNAAPTPASVSATSASSTSSAKTTTITPAMAAPAFMRSLQRFLLLQMLHTQIQSDGSSNEDAAGARSGSDVGHGSDGEDARSDGGDQTSRHGSIHSTSSTIAIKSKTPMIWAIQEMVKPLGKRFRFHFHRAVKTNRLDKPEWYFAHALKLIEQHAMLVGGVVQAGLDSLGITHVSAEVDFAIGVVAAVKEKMMLDSDKLASPSCDASIFSRTLNEAISFEDTVNKSFQTTVKLCDCVDVLALDPHTRARWIAIEREAAVEKFKSLQLTLSTSVWGLDTVPTSVVGHARTPGDVDSSVASTSSVQRTKALSVVVELINGITERISHVTSPSVRCEFLEEVICFVVDRVCDDLRAVWLRRICRATTRLETHELFGGVFNTCVGLCEELKLLCGLECFMEISIEEQVESERTQTIDTTLPLLCPQPMAVLIKNLTSLASDMIDDVSESVVQDFVGLSVTYCTRRELWAHRSDVVISIVEISPEFCPAMDNLKQHLSLLHQSLPSDYFTTLWMSVAEGIDKHLFDSMFLRISFGVQGAQQVKHDMDHLFAVFRPFTAKPHGFFRRVHESCLLLTMSDVKLEQVIEMVTSVGNSKDVAAGLKEELSKFGVLILSHDQVRVVVSSSVRGANILIRSATARDPK
jgi:hypothetical protein